ncbi:MAG: hypothetical protein V1493_05750 [Candidatus Diapherotrites archaeon]
MRQIEASLEDIKKGKVFPLKNEYKDFGNAKELEDKLAVRKMTKISREIKDGKRKIFTEKEAKKRCFLLLQK